LTESEDKIKELQEELRKQKLIKSITFITAVENESYEK